VARDEPRWHPVLAAREGPVGTWRMIHPSGREYGIVRLVRVDGVPTYRAKHAGEHLGYGGSLRLACERVHAECVRGTGLWVAAPRTTRSPRLIASRGDWFSPPRTDGPNGTTPVGSYPRGRTVSPTCRRGCARPSCHPASAPTTPTPHRSGERRGCGRSGVRPSRRTVANRPSPSAGARREFRLPLCSAADEAPS
jgi:hypothetical protein